MRSFGVCEGVFFGDKGEREREEKRNKRGFFKIYEMRFFKEEGV